MLDCRKFDADLQGCHLLRFDLFGNEVSYNVCTVSGVICHFHLDTWDIDKKAYCNRLSRQGHKDARWNLTHPWTKAWLSCVWQLCHQGYIFAIFTAPHTDTYVTCDLKNWVFDLDPPSLSRPPTTWSHCHRSSLISAVSLPRSESVLIEKLASSMRPSFRPGLGEYEKEWKRLWFDHLSPNRCGVDCSMEILHEIAMLSVCNDSNKIVHLKDVFQNKHEIILVLE